MKSAGGCRALYSPWWSQCTSLGGCEPFRGGGTISPLHTLGGGAGLSRLSIPWGVGGTISPLHTLGGGRDYLASPYLALLTSSLTHISLTSPPHPPPHTHLHSTHLDDRWFLQFFDSIFSPIYEMLFSFHVFGLGFITSMVGRGGAMLA